MIIDLDRLWNVSNRWNISLVEAYDLIMNVEEQQNEEIKKICCLDCKKNMFQDLVDCKKNMFQDLVDIFKNMLFLY